MSLWSGDYVINFVLNVKKSKKQFVVLGELCVLFLQTQQPHCDKTLLLCLLCPFSSQYSCTIQHNTDSTVHQSHMQTDDTVCHSKQQHGPSVATV